MGVDYLKYDYCYCNDYGSENNDYKEAISRYKKMGDALRATERPIVFSICEWGRVHHGSGEKRLEVISGEFHMTLVINGMNPGTNIAR